MKHTMLKRILHKRLKGGLSTYVFILFGMSVMLYLFGFTNMFGATASEGYRGSSTGNGTGSNLSDPNMQQSSNPLEMALNAILTFATKYFWVIIGGIGGIIALSVASYFMGGINLSVFYSYLIPIGLLAVFLNYFIFPINPTDETLRSMVIGAPGISVSLILIMFFNLWFILGVVDYIRSGQT